MSWLKGDRAGIEPRRRNYPGIWDTLRKTVKASNITYKQGHRVELRYKKHRLAFEGLQDDMQGIQHIERLMITHYLREPWSMPK